MTPRAYGDRALLLEVGATRDVVAWTAAVRDAGLPGLVDVVPGAETVLVVLDGPDRVETADRWLRTLTPGPVDLAVGPLVEVPVVYDGPDLDEVARLTGLAVDEVVAAHTGRKWSVAFGGFAPGFAYLVGGDEQLAVPRRATPRTSVPAGSVGLAGELSGVYPRSSPGGWQLIGRTDLPMWDLDRDPPALLVPGTTVRFVAVDR
ncbi:MAG: 5-oxoprolinase subunit PxpB [Aeromicrobium erythreum]